MNFCWEKYVLRYVHLFGGSEKENIYAFQSRSMHDFPSGRILNIKQCITCMNVHTHDGMTHVMNYLFCFGYIIIFFLGFL